jgi:hypothetical protein
LLPREGNTEQQVLQDLIHLTGYTDADAQTLNSVSATTQQWKEEVTQAFYDMLYGYSSTANVFRDGERLAREDTLRNWYDYVAEGQIDERFWQWQWFVGLVHIPRGISNPFMMGMMSRVQQLFLANCLEAFPQEQAIEVFNAFKRVTDVIAGLIAEGYFQSFLEAMERATGQSKALVARQVGFAVDDMLAEARQAM